MTTLYKLSPPSRIGTKSQLNIFLSAIILLFATNFKSDAQFTTHVGLPIAYWDFENNTTRTTLETTVEQQINTGNTYDGKFGGTTTTQSRAGSGITVYAGTAAGTAVQGRTWQTTCTDPGITATHYLQFTINTTGFSGNQITFDYFSECTTILCFDWPYFGVLYSTNGGSTFSSLGVTSASNGVWGHRVSALPASADNISNLIIRIYGYCGGSGAGSRLAIDNLTIFSSGLVASAGTKTSLNELNIYTSTTSGSTGSLWLRYGTFTVNSGATLNMGGQIAIGSSTTAGAISVLSGATFDCGSSASQTLTSGTSGLSTFTLASGGNLIVRSTAGIAATGATGNIQTTTRNFNAGGNYTYQPPSAAAQITGTGLPSTLTGNLTINNSSGVTLTSTTQTVNGTTTLTSGNLVFPANSVNTFGGPITIGTGTFYGVATADFIVNGSGTITGNVSFGSGGRQVNNFTFSRSNTMVLASNLSVAGNFTNNNSTALDLTTGTTNLTLNATAGTQTISGNTTFYTLTLNNSGASSNFGSSTTTIANNLTASAGTMQGGTSTVIFTGASGTIAGANAKNFYNLQFNVGSVIGNSGSGNIFVAHDYTNNGTFTQAAARNMNFNGGVTQTLSGSGTSTFGNFIIGSGSVVNAGSHNFSVNGVAATSFSVVTGSFNGGTGTVTFSGASAQTIGGGISANFNNLTINNAAGISISNDENVSGTLSFNSGKISTGSNTLILSAAAGVSGAGSSTYVNGNLRYAFNTGNGQSKTFDIGDATTYAPVNLTNLDVTTAGDVTAYTSSGTNPNENSPVTNSSGINQSARANRYWTLIPTGGFAMNSANATFNFSGVEASGNTANYVVRKYDGTWATTTSGTMTATSSQCTGITSFSEFEAGEINELIVNPNPSASAVCTGSNALFTSNVTAASKPAPSIQWQENSGSGFTNITMGGVYGDPTLSTLVLTGVTASMTTYQYRAVYTNINGTTTSTGAILTVDIPPSTSVAGSDQVYCAATSATLAGNSPSVGTGMWSVISGGGSVTTPGSETSGVTGLTTGTNTFRWTISNGTCPSSTDDVNINIDANPTTSAAGSDQALCAATSATLAGNTPSVGTGTWTVIAGGGSVTTPGSETSGVTGLTTGLNTFRWTISNGVCPSSSDDVNINIDAAATPSAAGSDQAYCAVTSSTLAGNIPSVGTGSWSVIAGGGSVTTPGSETSGVTGLTAGINTFRWTITNGVCVSTDDIDIRIYATAPAQPASISGAPASVCPPVTGILLSVPSDPDAQTYSWVVGPGTNGVTFNPPSSTNTQFIDLASTTNSSYSIRVTATNLCGTSPFNSVLIRRAVSVPASISGPSTICASSSQVYTTVAVAGATSYLWTGPSGSLIDGNTSPYSTANTSVTITMPPGFVSGTVSVAAQVACFTSAAKTMSVSTSASAIGPMTGTTFTVCPNSSYTFSVPSSATISSYSWTLPSGASGTSSASSIIASWGSSVTAGNICVTGTSICGVQTAPRCKSVISGVPARPASIGGPANGLCGQTVVYTTPPISGVSYNWTLPPGSTGSSSTNSISATLPSSFTTSSVCVNSVNSCGSSLARCITVKGSPNTPGITTTNPSSWCAPDAGIQFTGDVSGVTGAYSLIWSWIPSANATYVSGQGTSILNLDWNTAGAATVNLKASNSCGNATRTLSLNIAGCRQTSQHDIYTSENSLRDIVVFPNPANDFINVEFSSGKKEPLSVKITDLAGRDVLIQKLNAAEGFNSHSINIQHLTKGVYMLMISSQQREAQTRIVVQ